jgi:hypothetical protein
VDMSGRKELMKRIVERGAELPSNPGAWQGEMTISTRHTIYRFRDGMCFSVHRQDTGASQNECVGMMMTGWLLGGDGNDPTISNEWRPGASAVLLRASRSGDAIALTSPTLQVRHEAPRSEKVMRRAPRPPSYHEMTDSMTRIGLPRR